MSVGKEVFVREFSILVAVRLTRCGIFQEAQASLVMW